MTDFTRMMISYYYAANELFHLGNVHEGLHNHLFRDHMDQRITQHMSDVPSGIIFPATTTQWEMSWMRDSVDDSLIHVILSIYLATEIFQVSGTIENWEF